MHTSPGYIPPVTQLEGSWGASSFLEPTQQELRVCLRRAAWKPEEH